MPTYDPLSTYDVTATNISTVTFSSFGTSYTDLIIVISGTGGAYNSWAQINGNTGNNYRILRAYGRSAGTRGTNISTAQNAAQMGESSTSMITDIWFINEYNSSDKKQIISRAGNDIGYQKVSTGIWDTSGNAAYTSIVIDTNPDDTTTYFSVGTNITLYGIKAG